MRTIQMTIDEPLLSQVDQVIAELRSSRSEFIREALRMALQRHHTRLLEQQHEAGYRQHPATSNEFADWSDVQEWGEI